MAEWIEAVLYHLKRMHPNFRGKMYHISGLLPIVYSSSDEIRTVFLYNRSMRIGKIVPICLTCLCLPSCFKTNKGIAEHYDIVYMNEAIDKDALDKYFLDNDELYPSYQILKENCPDLLNHVKCIESAGNFYASGLSMFRFSSTGNGFLDDATFLLDKCYDGDYYFQLGNSFGGYGVTDFVRRQGNAGHWIYFLYSSGSGIHQSRIGAYEKGKHQLYSFDDIELENNKDFALAVDEKGNIGVYEATITPHYDNEGFETFDILKDKLVIDNIDDYRLTKK